MQFKSISIKNFRNYKNINVELNNKNVFFGMNDVGKTNFLYAIRYVFDKNIRKKGLIDTDFYKKRVEQPIEITVAIDISDVDDTDNEKLRAKVKGALLSNQDTVYIKLVASYDKNEMYANPVLYWGGDILDLQEIKGRGYSLEIDSVFDVTYIDAYVDLYTLFKKNTATLLKNDSDTDREKLEHINETINELNDDISSLSGIKNFEQRVTPEYESIRNEQIEVTVKSEMGVNGLFSNVAPYIKKRGSDELYPTSGEGRKKLLSYAIYDLLADEINDSKIILFLIEEPENHLHRAMQMALSERIFVGGRYKYTFMTTHSSHVLLEMDNVNLVRIYNETRINTKSSFYTVPEEFNKQKKQLNKGLVEAVFSDKVLLVEGPSEEVLFERVLSTKAPNYQVDGSYVLAVGGFGFKPYKQLLEQLGIKCIIKTDNDLRSISRLNVYSVIGFSRINGLLGAERLPVNPIRSNDIEAKRELYENNRSILDDIRKNNLIFLSRVSLEEDLDEVIHEKMVEYLPDAEGDPVEYLKSAKKYHMIELIDKLTDEDCEKIYSHYNFECLKEIL